MHLILNAEAKYDCVSEMEGDVYFESLNKCFCKHCIENYSLSEFLRFISNVISLFFILLSQKFYLKCF